ncbi:amino acid ABC transporter permease [Mastigocoleus sp. MO_188.B34]|uniref:amino acid ABC transporter permease n=1 Tax=Mastigocoleus sp. MO_188.B34 TaxID=3036635 RepID=UPI002614B90A|nr:amino acid ABC transporter permease [Mastigocoleus sp. MO_188.B34]MDJ0695953.1 amino acid ABC transporter permease [Mastigocoleus sp. MO_188.B34]
MEIKDKNTNTSKNIKLTWKSLLGFTLATILLVVTISTLKVNLLTIEEWQTLLRRLPYILIGNQENWAVKGGFALNIIISLACMIISTILGVILGLSQISSQRVVRWLAWFLTQFFRNSPWLVILYVVLYLFPFQINLGFVSVEFSPVAKSIVGLSLVVAANISEIVRGAIQSIPSEQWEAAKAMGYTNNQILRLVIFPQAFKRMIPPWMNWYAILTMGTTLTNLVGVPEGLTSVRQVLELEGERFAIPLYTILMLLFFLYCYPIAWWTRKLEQRLVE